MENKIAAPSPSIMSWLGIWTKAWVRMLKIRQNHMGDGKIGESHRQPTWIVLKVPQMAGRVAFFNVTSVHF